MYNSNNIIHKGWLKKIFNYEIDKKSGSSTS
jgi:hypothetical protein